MSKIDWKKAKRSLEDIDRQPVRELVVRNGAADRTAYFREYWRDRARKEVPKDIKCMFCKQHYAERAQWREFDGTMICKYCYSFAKRGDYGRRYYVDLGVFVALINAHPTISKADLMRKLKTTDTSMIRYLTMETKWVTRKTYVKFHRLGILLTENIQRTAPPELKRLRDLAKLTQKQAAEHLGMSEQKYAAIEAGRAPIRLGELDMFIEELKNGSELV